MQRASKIILGIDPGTVVMGYGIISAFNNEIALIGMGVLSMSSATDPYERLQAIHQKVTAIIAENKPDCFAIEAPFFGKNVQSMLKLGRAQGVAIAAAMQAGLSVCEYSPRKIKQSITGNGNADKLQVLKMLQTLLKFGEDPVSFDASDALAAAVCHHFQQNNLSATSGAGAGGWKNFLKANPGRIRK